MRRYFLLLFSAFCFAASLPAAIDGAERSVSSPAALPGGPPSIRIAGKATGAITRVEWTAVTAVKLVGSVADARVTSMTVCINNCRGKGEALTAINGEFTVAMKKMIANLPDGTAFTVKVQVQDGRGNVWEVPDAAFTCVW